MLAKFSNDTQMKVSSFHPSLVFQDKARMEGMEWVSGNGMTLSTPLPGNSPLLTLHVRHQQKSGWLPSMDEKLPSFNGGYYSLWAASMVRWHKGSVFFGILWDVLDVPSCIALWAPWAPWAKRGSVQTRAFRVMNLRLDFEEEMKRIERFVNLNLDWIHWIQCFVFSTFKNPTELFQKTASLITKIRDPRCNSWPKVVSDLSPGKGASGNQRTMALVGHGFRDFVDRRKSVSYIPIWILSWRLKVRSTKTRSNDKFHHFSTSSAFLPG